MASYAGKSKKLTKSDINEIFFNSDEEDEYMTDKSSSDESEGEGLPPNLEALGNPEAEGTPSEGEMGDEVEEVEEVSSTNWWDASAFTPPGPRVVFNETLSGVQTPSEDPTEAQCFKLFLTDELVNEIVEETNRYASVQQEMMPSGVKGKLAKWVRTTVNEMYSFLVAVLLMGIVRKSSLRDYWSTDPILLTPFFATLFSQDRFLLLLRCLHFVDSASADLNDPLHKIRNVFSALTTSFSQVFVPNRDLCVDESLMKWKGRLAFRQYIPSKRHRFGVKFFVLCDVLTGYVQDMIIYTGASTDITHFPGLGISGSVVMTLLAPHLKKGHILYIDNWYSSPTLFQHLLYRGTGACGTVRANRKGMPAFSPKMKKGEVEFQQNGSQLAVKWHDKRDVHMLTTVHSSTMAQTERIDHATGEKKLKPSCVLDYNKKMGAVDKADMVNSFVECARKTTKWYKKVFFHLIDTAVLNGHIVYRRLSGERNTQYISNYIISLQSF